MNEHYIFYFWYVFWCKYRVFDFGFNDGRRREEMNEISTPRTVCPKCGRPYKWVMTEKPIDDLIEFHFRCLLCGTTDNLSINQRQFYEFLWDMERKLKGGAE